MNGLGGQEQITQRMNEVQDRREVSEMLLPNRPVPRQTVAEKCLRGRLVETPLFGFPRHLPAEVSGIFHAADDRPHEAFGTPIGIRRGRVRLLDGRFLRRMHGTRRGNGKRLGFGDFRRVLRITETVRWFRLGIVRERPMRGTNQTGIFRLPPPFVRQMHASAMPRFSGPSAPAIAFHHRQFRRRFGTIGQPGDAPGGCVASRCQFATHVSHHTLDRIVGDDGIADLVQNERGTRKGTRLGRREDNAFDQARR